MSNTSRAIRWIAAMILVAVACVGALAYRAACTALKAETTLHAYLFVLDAATLYVKQHAGAWPENWEQLLAAKPRAHDAWPSNEEIRRRVRVDFAARPAEIVASEPADFVAVLQTEPNFGPRDERIRQLQDALRRGGAEDQ